MFPASLDPRGVTMQWGRGRKMISINLEFILLETAYVINKNSNKI